MAYPTLEEIKEYLGITHPDDDAYLQATLDAVIDAVEQYCQRRFPLESGIEQRDFNQEGVNQIYLQQWPIVAVSSIKVEGNALDANRYRINKRMGIVYFDTPQSGDIVTIYDGGFDPIPPSIAYVINESMKTVYANKDSDASSAPIKSERIDGALTVAYDTSGSSTDTGGSSDTPIILRPFTSLLETYRSERVWGSW
jgi:hypothetical protein